MPYIPDEKRQVLDPIVDELHRALVGLELDDDENSMEGNINYTFTRLAMMVYGDRDSTRYGQVNNLLGILIAVLLEYYRKVGAPYEDQKEFENGPIVRFRTEPEVIAPVEVSSSDLVDE